MCLVVAVWDKHSGVMASEGRSVSVVPLSTGGTFMRTVSDDHFKVHRLGTDLVLGAVGDCFAVDELRRAIAAEARSFDEMRDAVVPRVVSASKEKYPDACWNLLLMGVSDGRVRCAEWDSGSSTPSVPTVPVTPIGALAVGFSPAGVVEATNAVYDTLVRRKRTLPAEHETHAALARIVDDLSKSNPQINNRMRFESVRVETDRELSADCKYISSAQTQANIFVDPGDTTAVLFEAPSRLSNYAGGEIWIGVTGASTLWGGCNVLASMDGTTYLQVGTITAQARLGTLDSTFGTGSDPDTTNSLVVDLAENSPPLEAGTSGDADQGNTLCYVDGEIIAYSACAVSGQDQYTMGTYIRRGQRGSAIASHASGSAFLRLDDAVFKFDYDPTWAGRTVYFKFQSFNTFNNAAQDPSTLTPVTFAIPGQGVTTPPAQTTDIINPDFEVGTELPPYGWIFPDGLVGIAYDTTTPYAGSRSLVVTASASSGVPIISNAQKFVVTPGTNYQFSAAMKCTMGGVGSGGQVRFAFRDASGGLVSGGGGDLVLTQAGVGGWTLFTTSGPVPAGAVYAIILLEIQPGGHFTTMEWDAISLVRMPDLSSQVAGTLNISQVGARTGAIQYVIDGGGSVVTTGAKGQLSIPANCTVNGWTITADQSGSAVVDVLRSTYSGFPSTSSIAGTDKPTLSSAQKNQNAGPLSSWGSTSLSAGDILQFNVNSCSTCTRLIVTLKVSITG